MSRLQARILSVGCFSTLVAVMAVIDESFRGLLAGLLHAEPPAALSMTSVSIQHLGHTLVEALPVQITSQGPLVIFAVTGGALFLFMFRT